MTVENTIAGSLWTSVPRRNTDDLVSSYNSFLNGNNYVVRATFRLTDVVLNVKLRNTIFVGFICFTLQVIVHSKKN